MLLLPRRAAHEVSLGVRTDQLAGRLLARVLKNFFVLLAVGLMLRVRQILSRFHSLEALGGHLVVQNDGGLLVCILFVLFLLVVGLTVRRRVGVRVASVGWRWVASMRRRRVSILHSRVVILVLVILAIVGAGDIRSVGVDPLVVGVGSRSANVVLNLHEAVVPLLGQRPPDLILVLLNLGLRLVGDPVVDELGQLGGLGRRDGPEGHAVSFLLDMHLVLLHLKILVSVDVSLHEVVVLRPERSSSHDVVDRVVHVVLVGAHRVLLLLGAGGRLVDLVLGQARLDG
mmetsp:Transcript_40718/g.62153  ORF Transcript_40718/g.62153 Transcript_40718/m.62153 type:complete len:286 (-) Transcript_40718:19-876(-)